MEMESEYITIRKPQKSTSLDNIFNDNSTVLDTTMMSLPSTSLNESDTTLDLKDTVKRLTLELESAHQEIDHLNSENFRLKMDIGQYQKLIETLKKVNLLERKSLTPKSSRQLKLRTSCFSTPTKIIPSPKVTNYPSNTVELAQNDGDSCDNSFDSALSGRIAEGNLEAKSPKDVICNSLTIPVNPILDSQYVDESIPTSKADSNSEFSPADTQQSTNNSQPHLQIKATQRVAIFGDQTGYGVRKILQYYLGSKFIVTSFIKEDATTEQVLKSCASMCKDFSKTDFVIILAGTNDNNPLNIQTYLYYTLCQLKFTNVLVGQIYKHNCLNVKSVNKLLNFVCGNCTNSTFLSLHSDVYRPYVNKLHACRLIHRQILHINYKHNYRTYNENLVSQSSQQSTKNVSVQTISFKCVGVQTDDADTAIKSNDLILQSDFFRES